MRKTASIVDALTNPRYRVQGDGGAIPRKLEPPNDYQAVRVTLPDGKVIRGVLKNENSVSLQMLGVDDSRLHLLDRAKLNDIQSREDEPDAARLQDAADAAGISGSDGVSHAAEPAGGEEMKMRTFSSRRCWRWFQCRCPRKPGLDVARDR